MIRYYSEGYTTRLFEECLRARGYLRFVEMIEQPSEDASRAGRRMGGMLYVCGNRESTGPWSKFRHDKPAYVDSRTVAASN